MEKFGWLLTIVGLVWLALLFPWLWLVYLVYFGYILIND